VSEEWFATHAAGFGPLAARLAGRDLPGSAVRADGDNALRISLPGGPSGGRPPLVLLSYCRALFRLLGEEPGGLADAARSFARSGAGQGFERQGGAGSPRPGGGRGAYARRSGGTFVLRSFGPDDPAPIPSEARREIEGLIARAAGMRPDSARPDREYRLQERSDGRVLFLERIAAGRGEPGPRRGELPRTTCRLLAEMTEPGPEDVFLDPFCGYGGIALERVLAAPYRFVFASDTDAEKIAELKRELGTKAFEKRRRTFFPKVRDALEGSALEAGFVTAIATDPLEAFVAEATRLLAPGGRLVLLVAREMADPPLCEAAAPGDAFVLRERLDVLVSGKKASVLKMSRS